MNEQRWFRIVLRPKLFIPILLAIALMAFAFSISDLGRVWSHIRTISWSAAAGCLWFAFCYLAFKCLQFKLLLGQVGIDLSWRQLLLAFAVGEMMLQVPGGVYAENYVLKRSRGDRYSISTAATTGGVIIEMALSMSVLLLVGIPHWPWLRALAFLLLAGLVLVVALLVRSGRLRRLAVWPGSGWSGRALRGIGRMDRSFGRIFNSPNLAAAIVLAACYMGFLLAAYYTVTSSLGFDGFSVRRAVTIYLFAMSVSLFVGGLLPQLGVVELAGQGAARAWGYTITQGLSLMIGFRIVWIASIWLLCSPMLLLFWREFGQPKASPA